MKLVLLGTTGYYGNDHRQTACLMLPEIGVTLDAGSGLYRVEEYLQTERLDVFLTHAHLDHVIGLTTLLGIFGDEGAIRVTVHGSRETLAAVRLHLLAPALFPVMPAYRWQEIVSPTPLAEGGTLTAFPLAHPGGSVGFRLDWPGHSMAYVTDTTANPHAPYIENIRGVDLLLHEAYFEDNEAEFAAHTGHSCLTKVAEVAAAAGVGRLILVHIDPRRAADNPFDLTRVRTIFPQIEMGADRMEIEF
jgi:ribonuclease BN (tRNA processing enzyme)